MIKIEPAIVPHKGMTHIAIERIDDIIALPTDKVLAHCGMIHSKFMDWMDCPVASRWTLVRRAR